MPDQVHLFIVQGFNQANDISHKGIHTIRFYTLWFVTHVVTALVRDDDSTTRSCQGRDLFSPPIPELLETKCKFLEPLFPPLWLVVSANIWLPSTQLT